MIRVKVFLEDNNIKKVEIVGHANYDDYGKDIVCAAVSATYLCTVNACLLVDTNAITIMENDGKQEIIVINNDKYIDILLNNMINCLSDLERQYPKNIKISKEEI